MVEIKEQEKTCKNCEHYIAHYVIDNLRFMAIDGHCGNDALRKLQKQDKYRLQKNCKYWEPDKDKKALRREKIKDTL